MGWESPDVLRFDDKQVLIICLLLVLYVCNVKPTYRKSWARNLLMCSDLTLGPSFQGQMRIAKVNVLISGLHLVLEVCNMKPSYRKI